MDTQNARSKANSEPAETVLAPDTIPTETAAEDTVAEHVAAEASATAANIEATNIPATATEPKPSYVKLAMRNMVRKRGLSLKHFTLTTIGLLAFLVGVSYLTR